MKKYFSFSLMVLLCLSLQAQQVIDVARYGIRPDTGKDMTSRIQKMLK